MTSLTLFTSDAVRALLLADMADAAPFQTVVCVNDCTECCASLPAARTTALILELGCTTPAQAQDLMELMENADYRPALLLFERRADGSIRYTVSSADALPLSTALERYFTEALQPVYACSRWFFRSAPWPEKNTQPVSSERSQALVELMYGASVKEAKYYIAQYQLDLREAGYYAYYWELNYRLFADHFCYKDIYHFIGFSLREACQRVIENYSGGEVFYISLTQICAVINDFRLSSETQNRRRLNLLLSELTAATDSTLAAHYISKKFRSIRDFRSIYDTYLIERRMSFFSSKNKIFDSASAHTKLVEADPKVINEALEVITKYLNYDINNLDLDQALRRLFFDVLKPSCDFPMYYYTASVLASKLMRADPKLDRAAVSLRLDPNRLRHSTIEEEYDIFRRAVENLRRQTGSGKQSKSALVMKAMDFIRNHYRENILVADIASALYVSETYLSRICKTLTGKSVVQNLIDYRISQAKIILAEEDVAIYAIAEQCGFQDPRHFAKTFKKMTGQSPTEYRRSHF